MLALVDDHKGADRIFKILVDGEINIGLRQRGRFKGAEGIHIRQAQRGEIDRQLHRFHRVRRSEHRFGRHHHGAAVDAVIGFNLHADIFRFRHGPASIENAIQEVYSMVDERSSGYATNPMVSPLIEQMKENLRQQILDSAEQQRQENGQDGD